MTRRRVQFYTGAPDADELQWTEATLSVGLLPAFRQHNDTTVHDTSLTSTAIAKWRNIQVDGQVFYQTPSRAPTTNLPPFSPLAADRDDFLDHSLFILDNLQSSQLTAHDPSSFDTSTTYLESTIEDTPIVPSRAVGPLTSLSHLPSASHIQHIRPQTVTVNLIAAVLSVADERTVALRRGTGSVGIVEAVLGDDTRSPFGLTIWLNAQDGELRDAARALRRGDVILAERVALAVYGGVVYGQTLNRRVAGVVTRVTRVEGGLEGAGEAVEGRLRRVRDWVGEFVGGTRVVQRDADGKEEIWLPEDSQ